MIQVRSSGENHEFVREIDSNVSSMNESDRDPMEDDPPIVGIPYGILLLERMAELGLARLRSSV